MGRGRPDGMVGRVSCIFTGPRCYQVEVGGPPTLRPPPPPPHGVRLGCVEWPHGQGYHRPRGAAPKVAAPGGRRCRKARLRVPSWLLLGASRPRRDGHGERWRGPEPSCKGADRGLRVKAEPPLCLEFMHALTPHL